MTKTEYEHEIQQLVDCRIRDVRYHEILYSDENGITLDVPQWNKDEAFDSLDFGLDLILDDGSCWHITWGSEFIQYGLSVLREPHRYVGTIRVWPVADESRWRPLLGKRIISATVDWNWVEDSNGSNRVDYPQALRLKFESGDCVYLSAFEVRDNDFRMGCMDHITVFFEEKIAVDYGAWAEPLL